MSWLNVFTNCGKIFFCHPFQIYNAKSTMHTAFPIQNICDLVWMRFKGVRVGFHGKRLEVGLMDKVTEKCCPVAPDLQFYDSYIRLRPSITNGPLSKGFISRLLLERGFKGGLMDAVTEKCSPLSPDFQFYDS